MNIESWQKRALCRYLFQKVAEEGSGYKEQVQSGRKAPPKGARVWVGFVSHESDPNAVLAVAVYEGDEAGHWQDHSLRTFTWGEWNAFVLGAKDSEFDSPEPTGVPARPDTPFILPGDTELDQSAGRPNVPATAVIGGVLLKPYIGDSA